MSIWNKLFGSSPKTPTPQPKERNEMVFDVSLEVVRNRIVSGLVSNSEKQTITKAMNTLAALYPGLVSPQNVNVTIGEDAISIEVSVKTTSSNAARMKKDFIKAIDDGGPWR